MIIMPHTWPSHRCSSQARQASGTPRWLSAFAQHRQGRLVICSHAMRAAIACTWICSSARAAVLYRTGRLAPHPANIGANSCRLGRADHAVRMTPRR